MPTRFLIEIKNEYVCVTFKIRNYDKENRVYRKRWSEVHFCK